MANQQKSKETTFDIKYKLRLVVDIEGDVEDTRCLRDDSGIEPFIQWFIQDLENALDANCDVKKVLKIELEEVIDND